MAKAPPEEEEQEWNMLEEIWIFYAFSKEKEDYYRYIAPPLEIR